MAGPTVETILADRISAVALDHHLAADAIEAQKAEGRARPGAVDNLFDPADDDRDFGTRGPFGDRARSRSLELEVTRHRGVLATAGALAVGAAAAWWATRHAA